MLKDSLAYKADFCPSLEAAIILKKPEGTMGSAISVLDVSNKVKENKSIMNNGKIENFGRLRLVLPLSWYPQQDSDSEDI
jgi:hypothetical protein